MRTKSAFENALVDIDWDTTAPPPALRCPITGKVILYGYDPVTTEVGVDDYEQPDWASIPTVLFHYIGEVGEFDYIRPELHAVIDKKLDALEIETEKRAVRLIALRAPMAGDLRDVVAAMKISSVVERIGDYAKNIAKRVPLLDNMHNIEPISLMPDNVLKDFTEQQIRDLFAYLRSTQPLP